MIGYLILAALCIPYAYYYGRRALYPAILMVLICVLIEKLAITTATLIQLQGTL